MTKPKLKKKELDLISKWAIPSDYEIEKLGHYYGGTTTRVSVLEQAKRRKASVEKLQKDAMN